MTDFVDLAEAIEAELFPEADVALRSGRHIDRNDGALYMYIVDAAAHLERFYRRFGCELCERPDGYYYLVPLTDKVARRQLGMVEMIAGQALALLFLDPRTLAGDAPVTDAADGEATEGAATPAPEAPPARPGVVTQSALVAHLTSLLGRDALLRLLNPGRKRIDERVAEEQARNRIRDGVRKLAALGFVQLLEEDGILLRPALLRFADPVRGTKDPAAALEQLVAQGEIVLTSQAEANADDEPAEAEAEDETDTDTDTEETSDLAEPEPEHVPPAPTHEHEHEHEPSAPTPVPPAQTPELEPEPAPGEVDLDREPPEFELDGEPPDFELDRDPQDSLEVPDETGHPFDDDDGAPEA